MEKYLGVKEVLAKPMTRQEYNDYRGWELPENENGDDLGYLKDDGQGHIQWDPIETFNRDFRFVIGMSFGFAIEAAKLGKKIARKNWNGKNMFVVYMEPLKLPPYNTEDTFRKVNDRTAKFIGEDKPLNCQPYFAMYNAQEEWIPGWSATQSDMLSEDWFIVE